MKKLLDLLNEIEEKEVLKPVKEEAPEVVNEIGKFFCFGISLTTFPQSWLLPLGLMLWS